MTRTCPPLIAAALLLFGLATVACTPEDPAATDAADPAATTETPADQDAPAPVEGDAIADLDGDGAEGGKVDNPARPEGDLKPELGWADEPLELGFPTRGWNVFFGQGTCTPIVACQGLKAVKGEDERVLKSRADVVGLVSVIDEGSQAQALMRFFTQHRYVLTDEKCDEIDVGEDGLIPIQLPKDLSADQKPESSPARVVDFEGGFRVERTLACIGEETDRLVWVSETVFSQGNWEREEVEVLLEHEGLVVRQY
jgi:hypothetical protein